MRLELVFLIAFYTPGKPHTKHQLQHKINRKFNFWVTRNWLGPLNVENKLQVDKKNNKNWKKKTIGNENYHKV